MLRRLSPLLLLALVAALVGGCGDGKVEESNAYVNKVNDAQTRFAATSERLLDRIVPNGKPARNEAALDRFYGAVDALVADLRGIEAPERVRSLHERLIAAMVRFGTDLRGAGDAIVSRDASQILEGQQQLAEATSEVAARINRTVAAINDALKR